MDCGETTNGGAAKQPTGVWRNDQRDCGKRPTDVRQTTNGFAAKQPTGTWQNNQRGRGKTTNGVAAKRTTGLWRNDQWGRNTDGLLSMRMNCRNRYAVISISSPGIPHPRGFAGAQPRAISRNRSAVEYCQSCWFYWRISIVLVLLADINRVGFIGGYQSCWFYWRISIALVCLVNTNHVGCVGEAVKTNRVGCISEAGYQPRSGCGN